MAATIGALMVDIGANVARLQHDLNRAQSTFKRSTDRMKRMAVSLGVTLGASLGVSAMIRAGKQSLETADKYAKMSRSIGIAVEELSAYNHVAELSGTSFETVSKSAARLAANMKDTRDGIGEARDAFEELDIKVTGSDGKLKDTNTVMLEIADRFSKMDDGARKTALAMDIFGRSGTQMITMLNQGSSGIKAMQDEAKQLGVTFDTSTAQAAERINDQFFRVNQSFTGMSNKIMVNLLPDLENLSNFMFAAAKNTGEMERISKVLSTTLKLITSGALVTGAAFQIAGANIGAAAAAISFALEKEWSKAADVLTARTEDMQAEMNGVVEALQKIWEAAKPPQGDALVKTDAIINHAAEEATKAVSEAVTSQKSMISDVESAISRSFDRATDSIVEFATTGKASFKDFANSVIADMSRMAIQKSITNPLMDFLNTVGPAVLGSIGGPGPSTGAGGGLAAKGLIGPAQALGGVWSGGHYMAFASGGVVSNPTFFNHAGGTGLMGEKGPEAIMPLKRIGGKLGVVAEAGNSGPVVHMSMSVDARGSSVSPADLEQAVARGAEEGYRKVFDDIHRRGPIRRAL